MGAYNMAAAELCQKVTIYDKIVKKDSAGFDDEPEISVLHSCWAKFARISGTEAVKSGAALSTVRARFVIRATPRLTDWESKNLHILYRTQEWEVQYVNEYGDRHDFTEIVAELKERSEVPPIEPEPDPEPGAEPDD